MRTLIHLIERERSLGRAIERAILNRDPALRAKLEHERQMVRRARTRPFRVRRRAA